MDARVAAVAASQGGVILRRQALACGMSPDEVDALLDTRKWRRVRRGAYTDLPAEADVEGPAEHRLRIEAYLAGSMSKPAVSHVSAAVLHKLDMWRPELKRVHVTHPGQSSRIEGDIHHHDAELSADDVTVVDGIVVTSLARTAIDASRDLDFERSLVVCDSALRTGQTTSEELARVRVQCERWPGAHRVGTAVSLADGRARSVGESLLRAQCFRVGLPVPTPQVFLYDEQRRLVGIVDLADLDHYTVHEFDGVSKYGIGGQDPRDQVVAEKVREDDIRGLGYQVVRSMWSGLFFDAPFRTRVLHAFQRAAAGRPPRGLVRFGVVDRTGQVVPTGAFLAYDASGRLVAAR